MANIKNKDKTTVENTVKSTSSNSSELTFENLIKKAGKKRKVAPKKS